MKLCNEKQKKSKKDHGQSARDKRVRADTSTGLSGKIPGSQEPAMCHIRISILKKKVCSPPVQSAELKTGALTGAYGQRVCTGSASWQIRSGIFRPLLRGMGLWCIIRR